MPNQNQQQNLHSSNQVQPQFNHGGHEVFDAHEAINTVVSALEQGLLYEPHIKDQELRGILQRQRAYLTQTYNTLIETFKTGQEPSVPTQTYNMNQDNTVIYGLQPSTPKAPVASAQEIDDKCVSSFLIGNLKAAAGEFTLAALETTNPVLRRVFADSVPNLIELAYEIFLYQNKNQYYQVPQLREQDTNAILNMYAPIQGTTH